MRRDCPLQSKPRALQGRGGRQAGHSPRQVPTVREKDVFAELRRTPLALKPLCASSSPSLSGSQVLTCRTSSQTKPAHRLRTPCSENASVQAT